MSILVGPILHARSWTAPVWKFQVTVLVSEPDTACPLQLVFTDPDSVVNVGKPRRIEDFGDVQRGVLWGWDVEVRLDGKSRELSYSFGGKTAYGPIRTPRDGELPRIAFFSCNGFSEPPARRNESDPYGLWDDVRVMHRKRTKKPEDAPPGLQLLLGGGDQVYADSLWESGPLAEHAGKTHREMGKVTLSANDRKAVMAAYVDLYAERFQRVFGEMLSCVPGAFTWDDHDIFDGWGSYPSDLQDKDLFVSVFRAARRAFAAFQLGESRPPDEGHLLRTLAMETSEAVLDLALLDLRSDRSLSQVMSPAQHEALRSWLAQRKDTGRPRHVLVVSSVPMAYMRFAPTAEAPWTSLRPFHPMRIDDDMRDQWESHLHRGEKAMLVSRLFAHARDSNSRVTILSGDVHVASHARFYSVDPKHVPEGQPHAQIEQITSSAIVHPPPGWLQFRGMRAVGAEGPLALSSFVRSELLDVTDDCFLRERNWLAVAFEVERKRVRLWAQWRTAEGPLSKQVNVDVVGTEAEPLEIAPAA